MTQSVFDTTFTAPDTKDNFVKRSGLSSFKDVFNEAATYYKVSLRPDTEFAAVDEVNDKYRVLSSTPDPAKNTETISFKGIMSASLPALKQQAGLATDDELASHIFTLYDKILDTKAQGRVIASVDEKAKKWTEIQMNRNSATSPSAP